MASEDGWLIHGVARHSWQSTLLNSLPFRKGKPIWRFSDRLNWKKWIYLRYSAQNRWVLYNIYIYFGYFDGLMIVRIELGLLICGAKRRNLDPPPHVPHWWRSLPSSHNKPSKSSGLTTCCVCDQLCGRFRSAVRSKIMLKLVVICIERGT